MSLDNKLNNDLDLLAFRYIAAEMADEELQQFELRLAGDQEVREAVAQAVQISQAVAYARPAIDSEVRVASDDRATQRVRRLWVVVASSIAVAFLAGVGIARWFDWSSTISQPPVASQDIGPSDDTPDLAGAQGLGGATNQVVALWSASAPEFDEYNGEDSLVGGDETVLATTVSETWDSSDEDNFDVPSWMLAAVSPDDDPEESPFDSMPEEN